MSEQDNITSHLSRVYTETKVSPKTGNDYHVLVIIWNMPGGKTYKQQTFLTDESIALIEQSVSLDSANAL